VVATAHGLGVAARGPGPANLRQLLVGDDVAFDGLLQEALEQQSAAVRVAAVEAEDPFVEVGGHVLRADRAVQGAHDPALHKGEDQVRV